MLEPHLILDFESCHVFVTGSTAHDRILRLSTALRGDELDVQESHSGATS